MHLVGVEEWTALLDQAEALSYKLDSGDIDNIEDMAQDLFASSQNFFSALDRDDAELAARVSREGQQILKVIEHASVRASELKSDIRTQVSHLSRGVKGVNAYKNT